MNIHNNNYYENKHTFLMISWHNTTNNCTPFGMARLGVNELCNAAGHVSATANMLAL